MSIEANKIPLVGLECPVCGHKDCFVIEATCRVEFVGGEINPGYPHTFTWDKDSECQCSSCGYASDVESFSENEEEVLKKKFWTLMPPSIDAYSDRIEMLLGLLTKEQLEEACQICGVEEDEE